MILQKYWIACYGILMLMSGLSLGSGRFGASIALSCAAQVALWRAT